MCSMRSAQCGAEMWDGNGYRMGRSVRGGEAAAEHGGWW